MAIFAICPAPRTVNCDLVVFYSVAVATRLWETGRSTLQVPEGSAMNSGIRK